MSRPTIIVLSIFLNSCVYISSQPRECQWNDEQKSKAWANTKVSLMKMDNSASDFYYLSKPASELKFWLSGKHCELVLPLNPTPSKEYLDGGDVVHFDKSNQDVMKTLSIGW